MFKKKLQWKLVLFICLVALCLVIPLGLYLNTSIEQYHYNQFIKGIEKGFASYRIPTDTDQDAYTVYIEMRDIYAGAFNIYGDNRSYTILDRKTNRVYSSDFSYLHKDDETFVIELYRSENLVSAVAGTPLNNDTLKTIGDNSFYDYALSANNLVFYFRYYKADWQIMVSEFNTIILSALLVSLFVAFIVGYLLSKAITNPLETITTKTKSIAGGDFDQILEQRGTDEIGKLTSSINDMSRSLRNMLDEISNEKNKIEIIMNNMNEGIIAFDRLGEVLHVNHVALSMLGRETLSCTMDDFLRQYGIQSTEEEIIRDIRQANGKNIQIKRAGTILNINFALVTDMEKKPESVILILRDITRQQKLEDMRKEFVANVSHELKTPLTSIKSYSETLLSGMVEDQDTLIKFLRVIDSEAERMSNLVRDLLQLSSIDMDQLKLNKNRHMVMDLIQKTIEKVSFEADKKRQRITTDIRFEGKAPMDHDRIQQVLINLLGNAIKYTDEEGTIHVACWQQDDELRISVEDNGVGIPEKDLPRVFDRFYRVDKGRSRKMGGTGLGLAIAREIMLAHMGDISIESRLDAGTKVTLTLPLKYIGGSG